jgi:hypothetical protein
MAANTAPIFSKVGLIGINDKTTDAVKTANTTKDLTAGTIYLVLTADATNGSYVDKIVIQPLGTNVATVMRIFINNGSATGTAGNNTLYADVTLGATTNSEVAQIGQTVVNMNIALPPGYRIYVTIGTGVAAGFSVTAVAGTY